MWCDKKMQSFKLFLIFFLCFLSDNHHLKCESDDNFDKNMFVKSREFQKAISNSITRAMTAMDILPDRLMSLFEGQRQLSQALTEIFDKITVEFDKNPNEMPSDTELVINSLNKLNVHYREFAVSIKKDLSDLIASFKAQTKNGLPKPAVETQKGGIVEKVISIEPEKESISVVKLDVIQPAVDKEKILQARARLRKEMRNSMTTTNPLSA